MDKPMMTGEQTNVPQNEEELAAAMARKEAADKKEQEAHEAARAAATVTPERRHARVQAAAHGLLQSTWEQAEASGTIQAHINAVLFSASVILANAKTHGEYVKIIEYMSSTASGLKEKVQPLGAKDGN